MEDIIKKELVLNHPIDKVWDAISKEEEISTWFIKADFKAEVGYHYTFTSSEENDCVPITGIVKEADPYTLIYTWIVQGTEVVTTVKWVLIKEGNSTRLILEHSGISSYPKGSAVAMFNSFNGGWTNCVSALEKFLN